MVSGRTQTYTFGVHTQTLVNTEYTIVSFSMRETSQFVSNHFNRDLFFGLLDRRDERENDYTGDRSGIGTIRS